jgi:hypothetical protein
MRENAEEKKRIRSLVGQIPEPDELYGRDNFIDHLWRMLGRGASDQDFDEVMADLEYDWYLRLDPDSNEFYFRLKVMQDWWRRWYPSASSRKNAAKRKAS